MATAEAFQAYMRTLRANTQNRLGGDLDVLGRVGTASIGLRVGAVWYVDRQGPTAIKGDVVVSGVRPKSAILPIAGVRARMHTQSRSGTTIDCKVPLSPEWLSLRIYRALGELSLEDVSGAPVVINPDMQGETRALLTAGVTALLRIDRSETFGGLPIQPVGSLDM